MTTETSEYKIDRTGWMPGPWDDEPDKLQWTDTVTGLPCLIVRNQAGALCGYVGVPTGHPLHGLHYGDESDLLRARLATRLEEPVGESLGLGLMVGILSGGLRPTPEQVFSCHGSITYSAGCSGHICHVQASGEDDAVWWFGFDCNHAGDVAPDYASKHGGSFAHGTYRDVVYVRAECCGLARQIAEVRS